MMGDAGRRGHWSCDVGVCRVRERDKESERMHQRLVRTMLEELPSVSSLGDIIGDKDMTVKRRIYAAYCSGENSSDLVDGYS